MSKVQNFETHEQCYLLARLVANMNDRHVWIEPMYSRPQDALVWNVHSSKSRSFSVEARGKAIMVMPQTPHGDEIYFHSGSNARLTHNCIIQLGDGFRVYRALQIPAPFSKAMIWNDENLPHTLAEIVALGFQYDLGLETEISALHYHIPAKGEELHDATEELKHAIELLGEYLLEKDTPTEPFPDVFRTVMAHSKLPDKWDEQAEINKELGC